MTYNVLFVGRLNILKKTIDEERSIFTQMTLFWEWSWSFLPLCFVPCLPWWMGEGVFWRSKHRLFSLFWFYGGSDFWRNVCHGWVGGGGGLWHSNHRLTTACLTAELLLTCLALMASPDHQIIIAVITTTITICLIAADTPCSPDLSWSSDQSSVEVISKFGKALISQDPI